LLSILYGSHDYITVVANQAGPAPKIAGIPPGSMATLGRQLFADRRRRISDLVDQLLKLIAVHAEFPGPIFDLLGFVHVDLAAVRRRFLPKTAHISTPKTGN
jgi:hypothetical protein